MNELSRGCPCLYTTPCHERCTCVSPVSSSGCSRCCTYGSTDQRANAARRLAAIIDLGRKAQRATKDVVGGFPLQTIATVRGAIIDDVEHKALLLAMLDELAAFRAKESLRADPEIEVNTDDLPPDVPTGLYLDRPFTDEDLEWIKRAWDAYHAGEGPSRPGQIMLVFQAIRRDERATAEFLRVMNTIVLPLLRRLALKERPHLSKLGAASQ